MFTSKKVSTDVTNGLMSCAVSVVTTWERMILVPQVNLDRSLKIPVIARGIRVKSTFNKCLLDVVMKSVQ